MHHRDYALNFFKYLVPTFLGRPKDLESLREILARARLGENASFIQLLDNEIEIMEMILDIKGVKKI
jgi:hypothetical protein